MYPIHSDVPFLAILAVFGRFWPCLAIFGRFWPFLAVFGRCEVSVMISRVYPNSMECLQISFMVIIMIFMIMISLPK
jgi:hypothetical protein